MNITKEQDEIDIEIFIPGNTPSLKNSKIKTKRGVFHSSTVTKYLRSLGIQAFSSSKKTVKGYVDTKKPNVFKKSVKPLVKDLKKSKLPVVLGFHFVRKTKAKFDFNNANQIILDLLTAHDIIEDDNMDYVIPQAYKKDGAWYSHDKENPGVYIKIIKINE